MKIHYPLETLSSLGVGYIFFDTSSLIAIISYEKEFGGIIETMRQQGRALVTIPSVAFEFTRTDSIAGYNIRANFIKNFFDIYPIEQHLKNFTPLIPILQRLHGRMSYSDFLLYCCLYHFQEASLLTENHKDFTPTILDRKIVFTIDREENEIRNIALYTFNREKFEKAAADILKR